MLCGCHSPSRDNFRAPVRGSRGKCQLLLCSRARFGSRVDKGNPGAQQEIAKGLGFDSTRGLLERHSEPFDTRPGCPIRSLSYCDYRRTLFCSQHRGQDARARTRPCVRGRFHRPIRHPADYACAPDRIQQGRTDRKHQRRQVRKCGMGQRDDFSGERPRSSAISVPTQRAARELTAVLSLRGCRDGR